MSQRTASGLPSSGGLRQRRIRRVRREIELLSAMDDGLWRKVVLCGVLVIAALAATFIAAAWKFQYFGFGLTSVVIAATALAALVWWLGRYSLWLPLLMMMMLLAIIFETADLPDLPTDSTPDRKAERRARIARALEKRRLLLMRLEAQP